MAQPCCRRCRNFSSVAHSARQSTCRCAYASAAERLCLLRRCGNLRRGFPFRLLEGYGLSEASRWFHSRHSRTVEAGSIGVPILGVEMSIQNDEGHLLRLIRREKSACAGPMS